MIAEVVAGRFEVLELAGSGGMAAERVSERDFRYRRRRHL